MLEKSQQPFLPKGHAQTGSRERKGRPGAALGATGYFPTVRCLAMEAPALLRHLPCALLTQAGSSGGSGEGSVGSDKPRGRDAAERAQLIFTPPSQTPQPCRASLTRSSLPRPAGRRWRRRARPRRGARRPRPPRRAGPPRRQSPRPPRRRPGRSGACVGRAAAARGLLLLLLPCGAPAPPHSSGGAHCGHLLIRSPRPPPPPAAPPPIWRSGTVSERWCNSPTAFLPPVLACPPSREMVAH